MFRAVAVCHCQDHLELLDVSGGAIHRPADPNLLRMFRDHRGNGQVVLVARDGIPHKDLETLRKEDE